MSRTIEAIIKQTGAASEKKSANSTSQTMKAIRIHNYGGPEVLQYEEAQRPEPQAGEVLVRVHAAGVNPIDWKIREGHVKNF
jgi:D-arabinose 1-dehydrogenase-like Zn-dependent alcohol dehydrogenase